MTHQAPSRLREAADWLDCARTAGVAANECQDGGGDETSYEAVLQASKHGVDLLGGQMICDCMGTYPGQKGQSLEDELRIHSGNVEEG